MITLTPAYGRDYSSKKAALADLDKDWIINDISSRWDGKPCTPRRDLAGETVKVRYDKLLKVMVIKL